LNNKVKINDAIRASEMRVIGPDGENFGVLSRNEALDKAEELGYDLIEISPSAVPPIAKIMDFGKFQYELNKKQKEARSKSHVTETKTLQVKPGTGEHDLELKAKQASKWIKEGHRIKIDLFLKGRSKYMDFNFLKERIDRMLNLITEDFKIADPAKKSPKGITVVIEKGKSSVN
jgi:translation initiation factor IF-3